MRFQNALRSSILNPQSFPPFALSVFRAYIHLKNALEVESGRGLATLSTPLRYTHMRVATQAKQARIGIAL